MNEIKITIVVKTEKEFNASDMFTIMRDMKFRLEGYHTDTPEQLKDAELNLDKTYWVNDNEKDIFIEIEKFKEIEKLKRDN